MSADATIRAGKDAALSLRAILARRGARVSCALLCAGGLCGALAPAAAAKPPPIKHVFVIVLENESEATSFGAGSPAPYLATTLPSDGAFIPNYYGIGHASLDNYIAMISGQAPNPETQSDCKLFTAIPEVPLLGGQEPLSGCVYPSNVPTLPAQLEAKRLTWRSYDESMGAEPARESATCGHPPVGGLDNTQVATERDQYATRHDPFVYFNAIISDPGLCDRNVVNLDKLPEALASETRTANYSFITPDLCDDGHNEPCQDKVRPGGLPSANAFLEEWVPRITASPAYRRNGLLIITFDEAVNDSSSCCGEKAGPATPTPGGAEPGGGSGGGKTGAVLLSPYIAPCTVSNLAYNHYSMLGSVERLFGLAELGYASGTTPFGSDVFTSLTNASRVFRGAAVHRSTGVATLSLAAIRPGQLKVIVHPGKDPSRTLASRRLAPCTGYSFKLPSGHGRLTVLATVGRSSQTATLNY